MSDQDQEQQIVTKPETGKPYPTGFNADDGFIVQSMEDAYRMAGMVLQAGWAPKGVDTREAIVIAWQHGAELGLGKMSSLQNLAIINGRPCLWGDVMLGLVMATGKVEDRQEWWEINDEALKDSRGNFRKPRADEAKNPSCTAFFLIKRRGIPTATTQSFSMADAIQAGYDKKDGPWKTNPTRMIQMRARGFGLRDAFPDTLKGVMTREEAQDIALHQGFDNAKVVAPMFKEPASAGAISDANPPAALVKATKQVKSATTLPSEGGAKHEITKTPEGGADTALKPVAAPPATVAPAADTPPAGKPKAEPEDTTSAAMAKIAEVMKSYDVTEADVLAFAKERGILSPRNRMPMADLPDNILGMIVAQLPALIEKFTTPHGEQSPP
jgi:hypothetical protein